MRRRPDAVPLGAPYKDGPCLSPSWHIFAMILTSLPTNGPRGVVHHHGLGGVYGGVRLRVRRGVVPVQIVPVTVLPEMAGRNAVWVQQRNHLTVMVHRENVTWGGVRAMVVTNNSECHAIRDPRQAWCASPIVHE